MEAEGFKTLLKSVLAGADPPISEVFVKGLEMPDGGFAVEAPDGSQFTIVVAAL